MRRLYFFSKKIIKKKTDLTISPFTFNQKNAN